MKGSVFLLSRYDWIREQPFVFMAHKLWGGGIFFIAMFDRKFFYRDPKDTKNIKSNSALFNKIFVYFFFFFLPIYH